MFAGFIASIAFIGVMLWLPLVLSLPVGVFLRQVNRASRLADDAQLVAGTAFVRMLTRPDTQAQLSKLMSLGLQQRGDFELRLGHYLGAE